MYKEDLTLDNLQWLICLKIKKSKHINSVCVYTLSLSLSLYMYTYI